MPFGPAAFRTALVCFSTLVPACVHGEGIDTERNEAEENGNENVAFNSLQLIAGCPYKGRRFRLYQRACK